MTISAILAVLPIIQACDTSQPPAQPIPQLAVLGALEPTGQDFEVNYGPGANPAGGIVGGQGAAFRARITVKPRVEMRDEGVRVILDAKRVTKKVLLQNDPGGLALVGWLIDLSGINDPSSGIVQVRATFDHGEPVVGKAIGAGVFDLSPIPPQATKLTKIEVDFEWLENTKTLTFQVPTPQVTSVRAAAIDPQVSREEAVPLQFFRVSAAIDRQSLADNDVELRGSVSNPRLGTQTTIRLTSLEAGTFVSPPILLSTPGADPNEGLLEVPACPGDRIQVLVGGQASTFAVKERVDAGAGPSPCDALPKPTRVKLEPASQSKSVTIDPAAGRLGEVPSVKLTDQNGLALGGEAIVWRVFASDQSELFFQPAIPERNDAQLPDTLLTSNTDSDGVARLDFALGRGGIFLPVIEGHRFGPGIGDGRYRVVALPRNGLLGSLLMSQPPAFDVDLVQPTTLEFLDEVSGSELDALLGHQRVYVRVRLGRADRSAPQPSGSNVIVDFLSRFFSSGGAPTPPKQMRDATGLGVTVTTSSGDTSSRLAERTATPGIFATTEPLEPTAVNGGTVTAALSAPGVSKTQATIPYYTDRLSRLDAETRISLSLSKAFLDAALKAGGLEPEAQRQLQMKRKLVGNAEAWRAALPPGLRVQVALAYLQLLSGEKPIGFAIDQPAVPESLPRAYRDRVSIRYVCSGEVRLINDAINSAVAARLQDMSAAAQWGAGQIIAFPFLLPESIVAPFYTLATGYNMDGRVATRLERTVAGITVVATVVPVGWEIAESRLAASTTRIDAFANAARSLETRAALAETTAAEVSFAEALEATPETALSPLIRRETAAAAEEAAASIEASEASAPRPGPGEPAGNGPPGPQAPPDSLGKTKAPPARTPDWLLGRSQEEAGWMAKRQAELDATPAKISEIERQIDELKADPAMSLPGGPSFEAEAQVLKLRQRVARLRERLEKLPQLVEHHRVLKESLDRSLAQTPENALGAIEIESLRRTGRLPNGALPRANDTINGTRISVLYERQQNASLAGFKAGGGFEIRSAYQSPLGPGFGSPTSPTRVRKSVEAPRPDHINLDTLDVADSKYYDFSKVSGANEPALRAAREIADTVEKGRLVQAKLVRERWPAGVPIDESAVTQQVITKKMIIVTPTDVPASVQQLIRKLVGPRTGGETLIFQVVPLRVGE